MEREIKEINPEEFTGDTKGRIEEILKQDKLILFMKGNADFPQCGFSMNTVSILKTLDVSFSTFNILMDQDIRQGLKEYSNWPTFPQLYLKGSLVGGNDIITELYREGELQSLVSEL